MMLGMKIITIGTLKGGTGKTATCFNLSGILARDSGVKILLIDMDTQTNLSLNVGIDVTAKSLDTIKNIFENERVDAECLIIKGPMDELPNIDIIPSSIQLTGTELNIINRAGREQILLNFMKDNDEFLKQYDYIIIDTNPSMSIINQNAFLVADNILLVSDVSLNGIQGAELFMALWNNTIKQLRRQNNISALIINNFDKRLKVSTELLEYCNDNEDIKNIILQSVIPSSVKIKETELEHKPINLLHKDSVVHKAFSNIVFELKEKGIL